MSDDYLELLKDPRWQRKRLEAMQRADFACEECGAKNRTLNVHHTYYERGNMPWEYPSYSLLCLCEGCHGKWHEVQKIFRARLAPLTMGQMIRIIGYYMAIDLDRDMTRMVTFMSDEDAQGFADGLGLSIEEVFFVVGKLGITHGRAFLQAVEEKRSPTEQGE